MAQFVFFVQFFEDSAKLFTAHLLHRTLTNLEKKTVQTATDLVHSDGCRRFYTGYVDHF
jgi:hypothetical protein